MEIPIEVLPIFNEQDQIRSGIRLRSNLVRNFPGLYEREHEYTYGKFHTFGHTIHSWKQ